MRLLTEMLRLEKWGSMPLQVQFLSSDSLKYLAGCPPLPPHMAHSVAPLEVHCSTFLWQHACIKLCPHSEEAAGILRQLPAPQFAAHQSLHSRSMPVAWQFTKDCALLWPRRCRRCAPTTLTSRRPVALTPTATVYREILRQMPWRTQRCLCRQVQIVLYQLDCRCHSRS